MSSNALRRIIGLWAFGCATMMMGQVVGYGAAWLLSRCGRPIMRPHGAERWRAGTGWFVAVNGQKTRRMSRLLKALKADLIGVEVVESPWQVFG